MNGEKKLAMKEKFEELVSRKCAKNCVKLSKKKYDELILEVKNSKLMTSNKKSRHYWLLQHYDIVKVDNIEKLIVPIKDEGPVKYYCYAENFFDILFETHLTIGHGGRDRMRKEINRKYKNITVEDIQIFLNLCEPCQQNRQGVRKGVVVKPMISRDMNSRCQVDLIDLQSQPDGDFKFVFVYQDHLTKFVVLRPLKCKEAETVVSEIISVFLLFGAPCILQSDNGREFRNKIVDKLKVIAFFLF